jgi:hypothetical protein
MKRFLRPLAVLFAISSIHSFAFGGIEPYLSIPVGSVKMTETNSGTYDHKSSPLGHVGLGLGLRLKLDIGNFGIGGIAEYAWIGDTNERGLTGSPTTTTYRNDMNRLLGGGTVSWGLTDWFRLLGEYYPVATSKVIYGDEKPENPWRKNDTLTATGWGAGVQFKFAKFTLTALYRSLDTKSFVANGVDYSAYKTTEVASTFGLEF